MKIQTKIALHFLALSTGILLLLNVFILYFEYQFNYKDFFKRLAARVNITADIKLLPEEKTKGYQEVRNRFLEKLDGETEIFTKASTAGFTNPGLPNVFFQDLINNNKAEYKEDKKFFSGKIVNHGGDRYLVVVTAQNP